MGKTLEIRLSDAQHAALSAAHQNAGGSFFEFCRAKLMEGLTSPVPGSIWKTQWGPETVRPAPEVPNDRISRIEDALTRLTDYVLQGQAPAEAQHHQAAAPVDIDSLVNEQFAEAEAAGLTQHLPDEAEEQMDRGGVRPLSRRPIAYSSHSVPRHLQDMR